MWGFLKKEQQTTDLVEKILGKCEAVYHINKTDKSFRQITADPQLSELVGETGTIYHLYKTFFTSGRKGENTSQSRYTMFDNDTIFFKDSYAGHLTLMVAGAEREYDYRIFEIEENESVFMLIANEFRKEDTQYERMKMESIQENFLFSMIIDLKQDKCINSNTTEVSADDQNYLDMTYSNWREMISNMFLPIDRITFMNFSAPENIIKQLEKQSQMKYEMQMMNMQGEFIWTRLTFSRMKGFTRENPICVYTVQDIHEDMLQLLQQENIISAIKEKNQQLADINKAQNMFISNMSHEIRTPINAVLGLDDMILRECTDETILGYAADIKIAGKMLLSLINDILDYSKIEAGKIRIIPTEYNLKTLIAEVNAMVLPKVKEKELGYYIHVNESVPSVLYGDDMRIKQIMINILNNAVKYTEKGKVTWFLDYQEIDSQTIALKMSVKDTGIGIRQEDLKNLATQFKRFDEKRNRDVEGTGLGMSIVTGLLQQMGSELQVESEYEVGSTFSFVLKQTVVDKTPLGEVAVQRKPEVEKKEDSYVEAPNAKILIVDDNKVNLMIIEGLLKRSKAQLESVLSGQECLDKLQENRYDLVLLDHFMPEMDGIETLHRIRQMGLDFNKLPVVALTANAESDSKEQYLNMGFNEYLEKPLVIDELEKILGKYL